MKKFLLILGILAVFSTGLYAHPMGFKLVGHSGPRTIDEDAGQLLKSIGIDAITYTQETFHQWCDSIIDYGIDTVYYGVITLPSDAGAYGNYTKWYARGDGLVGRYFDWRMSADSMALWHSLIDLYTDTVGDYADAHSGLISYRMMDGDSGYNSGVGLKHSLEGLQILFDSLEQADSKLKDGSHYTYCWGSYNYPKSLDYYLDLLPSLDVTGPGAYIFSDPAHSEDSAQAGLRRMIQNCRSYARALNNRGKVYMPLIQCSRIPRTLPLPEGEVSVPPTLEELRAAHWVALVYGSAWIGYYEYRGHSNYIGESNWQGTAGVVEKEADQAPYCLEEYETYLTDTVEYDGPVNNNDNTYVNLHRVIQEIRQIGDTLGNLTWLDGFSKSECPRGWVKEVSYLIASRFIQRPLNVDI